MTRQAYQPRRARHWASIGSAGDVMIHTDMGADHEVRKMVRMTGRRVLLGPYLSELRLQQELAKWRYRNEVMPLVGGKEQSHE